MLWPLNRFNGFVVPLKTVKLHQNRAMSDIFSFDIERQDLDKSRAMRRVIKNGYNLFTLLILIILLISPATPLCADAYVEVSLNGFSPSSVSIAQGDSVYWMQVDDLGPYAIVSSTGAWAPAYLYVSGDVVTVPPFNKLGDFFYYDGINGFNGVVHVGPAVPNLPPSVAITTPQDGAVFTAPATFTFEAHASDPDDGLSDVEFYVGSEWVDDVFSSPFSTTITNLAAGAYVLQAIAYDYTGATATNSISITVRNGTGIKLGAPRLIGGQFQFDVAGLTIGKQVVLQSTMSLGPSANWMPLQTNQVNSASTSFSTAVRTGNHFYRVQQLP